MTPRHALNRRALLRVVAATALTVPATGALTACASGFQDRPDPLRPLWRAAREDAEAAEIVARNSSGHADLARHIAAVRRAHADALWSEVARLNRPADDDGAPKSAVDAGAGVDALARMLSRARGTAVELVTTLPRHRAGLVGAVAAGCAAAQQLAPELGGADPAPLDEVTPGELTATAVQALQDALAAEHAAVWVYGLVSAFLPTDFRNGITAGAGEHRRHRDASERVLVAAGATPRPPEPAYVPPEPVSDEASAVELVVTAEADVTRAWHGVLERCDDGGLRTLAVRALLASASRGTHWRVEAGHTPAAPALPGRESSLS